MIDIAGEEKIIQLNLYAALKHVRQREEHIHLWVDAVSIKQIITRKQRESRAGVNNGSYVLKHQNRLCVVGCEEQSKCKCMHLLQLLQQQLIEYINDRDFGFFSESDIRAMLDSPCLVLPASLLDESLYRSRTFAF